MHRTSPAQAGRTTGEGSARGPILGVWLALLIALFLPTPSADAQPTLDDLQAAGLPRHVYVAPPLRDTVAQLLLRSPTFRAQMEAIARCERLGLAIALEPPAGGPPARAEIRRFESGVLLAVIRIRTIIDKEELVAHEVEHVLEQIEGVRLEDLSRAGREAWHTGGSFESERAIRAGRRVAMEAKGRDRLATR